MRLSKYDRLLYILNLIRSRKNLNADSLAIECGVTARTIYRDIISLSEANVPIYYDNGYKYASGNFLPPLNFDINEYLVLKKVLDSTPLTKSSNYRQLVKSIKSKIDSGISPIVKKQKLTTPDTTQVSIKTTMSEDFSSEFFAKVENGIRHHNLLEMKYNSVESGIMKRDVEPYFLIFIDRAFYFVGYCYIRKQLRTFRIDRIVDIKLTDKKFVPRTNIDPVKYFENSWGVFSGEPVKVEAIFEGKAARVASLGRHHPNEVIKPLKGGRIKYTVTVAGVEEISRWLLGFGSDVTVIKPESLALKLKRTAQAILDNYK
jgi:predicted DNA-binding transcriptional regulator YafY